MSIINFPQRQPIEPAFFPDIREDGYHIYSIENAKIPSFYPSDIPNYPGVVFKDIREDDIITIRIFFDVKKDNNIRIESGYIDLELEFVDDKKVMAVITTVLPEEFALNQGNSIEVFQEEILYRVDLK
ncbi:MAG: hypothetical protein GY710_09345 [Desulfobacteraceae bacterium]|nr:hypothetical protein [Desulfobacteraceae bacterium]